jgi:hypothetical protein
VLAFGGRRAAVQRTGRGHLVASCALRVGRASRR